jgi:branched-chain amino acid transport system permease protein
MQTAFGILIDSLAYGMVLFVICVGLSIMMGLMRVVNLAHGAFAMIGGYFASTLTIRFGFGYGTAILLSVLATIVVAMPLERLLYRPVYGGAAPLPQVLMTIGIAFVAIGLANHAFGPTMKPIPVPALISGPVDLGIRHVPAHRIFVVLCGLATALLLWLLVERTGFGIRLRAAVDHPAMAAALGIRVERIYAATFALAVGLGAFGGIVGAEMLPIEPYYALRYIVTFLVVVSVGGPGSIGGALAASLLLGFVDTTGKYLFPDFGEFFFYIAVSLIVFWFPKGISGRARA